MHRAQFNLWEDLGNLDQPGSFMNECKSLIDQIVKFTFSEAPYYGDVPKEGVEKQDTSYRLLEEQNFSLRSYVLSLENMIQIRDNEIVELKKSRSQLQCQNKDGESLDDKTFLPQIDYTKNINSTLEDTLGNNLKEQLRNKSVFATVNLECHTGKSTKESNHDLRESSVSLSSASNLDLSEPMQTETTSHKPKHYDIEQPEKDAKLKSLEKKYFSLKRENIELEEKVQIFLEKIKKLTASLQSSELELAKCDNMLTLIKEERISMVSELRMNKQDNSVLNSRNKYLESRVIELENEMKSDSMSPGSSQATGEADVRRLELLNDYKNRLYEAFKETSVKEDQIAKLDDSFYNLLDKFNEERKKLKTNLANQLKNSEERRRNSHDENLRLEEKFRQQSRLIDQLQMLIDAEEKKRDLQNGTIKG